jgi:hypothetical protein
MEQNQEVNHDTILRWSVGMNGSVGRSRREFLFASAIFLGRQEVHVAHARTSVI